MIEARWQRLSEVYDAAVALAPDARAAFLDDACGQDRALRADVESLLRHGLPSSPAIEVMASVLARSPAPLIGTRMGHYLIEALVGEGGMGQVYRARDQQLHRDVAIKVLPPVFALDADRRARFEREARLLASLNHPNVGAIYGIAEGDGVRGLVLEFVDGRTLADRLDSIFRNGERALSLQDALAFARQIADALDSAHEKGIIHRDLKPANIKITSAGTVKVLDFGLAKAAVGDDDVTTAVDAETRVQDTRAGAIIGTAAYMSPEQAQGKPVDKRTDIWAFGCVLYEMLTGRPAFARKTVAETLAAVVNDSPDLGPLASTSPRVTELVRRCLEKDPRRRLRDIGDASIALEDAVSPPALTVAPRDPSADAGSWSRRGFMMSVTAASGAALAWMLKPPAVSAPPRTDRFAVPIQAPVTPGASRGIALSPDGRQIAYVADDDGTPMLCVASLEDEQCRILAGTEGPDTPFFSPDGKSIAFFAGGSLRKVPAAGGPVETIVAAQGRANDGRGGTWLRDDTIVFAGRDGIFEVSAEGGNSRRLTTVDPSKNELSHRAPVVLPDGETILFVVWWGPGWDERQLVAYRRQTRELKPIPPIRPGIVRYAPTGHLVYTRAGELWAVAFDPVQLKIVGTSVLMSETVRERTIYADLDLASNGSLAYFHEHPDAYKRRPVLVHRVHKDPQPLPNLDPAYYQGPTFSPDGRYLALMITDAVSDIIIYDVERQNPVRARFEGSTQYPVLSGDGWVYYRATRSGRRNVFRRRVDLRSREEQITDGEGQQTPQSISSNGRLLYQMSGPGSSGIWMVPVNGDRKPQPLLEPPSSNARLSPDGRWLAFRSGGAVWVQRFPDGTGAQQVAAEATDPAWAASSNELFYLKGRTLMSVTLTPGSGSLSRASVVLEEGSYVAGEVPRDYDVHPDGQRFVRIQPTRLDPPAMHISYVQNWFEKLKSR